MTEKRPRSQIAKFLSHIEEPIYFVDSQWRIRFCNRVCLEWLACREEDILDRRCAFHSSVDLDPGDALAAGLCPPPGAFEAEETEGTIACLTPEGRLRRRRARFIRIHGAKGEPSLLVIAARRDLTEEPDHTQEVVSKKERHDVEEALKLHEQIRQFRQHLVARFGPEILIGASSPARRLQEQIHAASKLESHIVVIEPPGGGAGTELARAVFYATRPEPQQCLVPLPCQGLDPEILQNMLRAFEAVSLPPGLRHTFILENIDHLPEPTQHVLYDFLRQQNAVIRVISTTEKDLIQLAAEGKMLDELAHLLSAFSIIVPPLRERREDIPLIAQALLEDCNTRGLKQVMGFTEEVLEILTQHNWPHNYAELKEVIHQAHNQATGKLVGVADLPRDFRWNFQRRLRNLRESEKISLPGFLAQVEKELLMRAMHRARGNKSLAAKMLGISRPRLYRRLIAYGLVSPDEEQGD